MKKTILLFATAALSISLFFAQEAKYRIDGKSYNKQIYDEHNNQITHYKNWERIDGLYISPDNEKMLVWHRPDKARAYVITLYDLRTNSIIAECEPGYACFGVRWTPDYLIYMWATTGGGKRFEYRSYTDLAVEKTVTAYFPFEDSEDDILIEASYFYGDNTVVFHNFSDGSTIKTIDIIEELKKQDIHASGANITDIKKTGKRTYTFYIQCSLGSEGNDDKDFQAVLEYKV